jgi:Ribosomal protein L16p/L10e
MGKGKGTFDHWGLLAPAGKVLFEITVPEDVKLHIIKEALQAAGMAIPGPVQFLNRANMVQPAYCGRGPSPVYHAGIKVDGSIDTKVRAEKAPSVVVSPQIGYEKLQKHNTSKITVRKGLVRR